MNSTPWALGLKFGFTFIAGLLTLTLFDDNPWPAVLGWSAAAAAINYFLGDRFVLPSLGNAAAAWVDGIVSAALAWLFGIVFAGFRTTGATLIALAAFIALSEYFFHVFFKPARAVTP